MQKTINSIQPRFIKGMANPNIPYIPLARFAEDENCEAGCFAFEGTDPEVQVVGTKTGATKVVGIILRTPFQTYNGEYNDIYKKGAQLTVLDNGNACVEVTNNPSYGDKVFVNPTTKEIQTGTGSAPSDFIDTGFVVTATKDCGKTIEISNK